MEELLNDPNHLFWKHLDARDATRAPKSKEEGTYFGVHKNRKSKFGSFGNLKDRMDAQDFLFAVLVMTTAESIEALGLEFIQSIIQIRMPSLKADSEQQDILENLVARQATEGILGCVYATDCKIYFLTKFILFL